MSLTFFFENFDLSRSDKNRNKMAKAPLPPSAPLAVRCTFSHIPASAQLCPVSLCLTSKCESISFQERGWGFLQTRILFPS